jgi:hypothetical protein
VGVDRELRVCQKRVVVRVGQQGVVWDGRVRVWVCAGGGGGRAGTCVRAGAHACGDARVSTQ